MVNLGKYFLTKWERKVVINYFFRIFALSITIIELI